jgi:hypothetical protein
MQISPSLLGQATRSAAQRQAQRPARITRDSIFANRLTNHRGPRRFAAAIGSAKCKFAKQNLHICMNIFAQRRKPRNPREWPAILSRKAEDNRRKRWRNVGGSSLCLSLLAEHWIRPQAVKTTNAYRTARYRWRANQVRAKARRRIERATMPLQPEPTGRVYRPRLAAHLWTITVAHRDGSKVILHSDELPGERLTISPSLMGRKISTAMRLYQPIPKNPRTQNGGADEKSRHQSMADTA